MSGGEYTTFTGDKRFEQRVVDAAKHMRNRYLITFSPSDPTPGLHTIRVRTAQDYGARIVARANYWLGSGAIGASGLRTRRQLASTGQNDLRLHLRNACGMTRVYFQVPAGCQWRSSRAFMVISH